MTMCSLNTVMVSSSTSSLYITTESTDQSEEYFVDANNPREAPTLFLAREAKHEYAITDGDDRFYIVTNDNAENFKLMETPIDRTSKENWQVVVPHREDVLLETVTVFKEHIVIEETDNGLARIAYSCFAALARNRVGAVRAIPVHHD